MLVIKRFCFIHTVEADITLIHYDFHIRCEDFDADGCALMLLLLFAMAALRQMKRQALLICRYFCPLPCAMSSHLTTRTHRP